MACDWGSASAANRTRNPHEALGDFALMLEKRSLMQLIQLAMISYIIMVPGGRGVLVGEVGLLDFIFLFLLLRLSGFDRVAGIGSVLTGLLGDILLNCGLSSGKSFLTCELGTGVG